MTFIDTGERRLGITAAHVYKSYLTYKRSHEDIECQVGSVRVALEDYLVSINTELDIATFDISPILVCGSGALPHALRHWPPTCLAEGEIVVLGGYPGLLRQEQITNVDFGFVTFFARIAQALEDHGAVQLTLGESHWPDGSGGVPEQSELGGMSGGPVFRFHADPLEYLDFAGIIY